MQIKYVAGKACLHIANSRIEVAEQICVKQNKVSIITISISPQMPTFKN